MHQPLISRPVIITVTDLSPTLAAVADDAIVRGGADLSYWWYEDASVVQLEFRVAADGPVIYDAVTESIYLGLVAFDGVTGRHSLTDIGAKTLAEGKFVFYLDEAWIPELEATANGADLVSYEAHRQMWRAGLVTNRRGLTARGQQVVDQIRHGAVTGDRVAVAPDGD